MRKILKKIFTPILQKASAIYLSRPRIYRYKQIRVIVMPTVFPPFITISTRMLLEFTETLPLKEKTFLELGCGTGIISILASKIGATVTASDINEVALSALRQNSKNNNCELEIVSSDLFSNLKKRRFDFIMINPPYYPKSPQNTAENAWYCGSDFEYFRNLFPVLFNHVSPDGKVYMILSEDCNINMIQAIAHHSTITFHIVKSATVHGERNFIFELTN